MNYSLLGFGIILQAVLDYKEAVAFGLPTEEVEEFFESEWCDWLLGNIKLTGKDILKYLKNK